MVRTAPIGADDVTLDVDALEALIGERTRVVAFTLASNAVGSIPDAGAIAAAAHAAGALAWADGVHLAPHRRLRARELGLDVLLCSPYKFFGPHLGVAAIRPELAESLPADRVRPAGRGPAGPPLRDRHASRTRRSPARSPRSTTCARSATATSTRAFARDPRPRGRARAALPRRLPDGVELYGIDAVEGRARRPSASTSAGAPRGGWPSCSGERGIYVWDGDYYALEPMRALGLAEDGGAVRAGFLHYTTEDEVDRLLEALDGLPR